MICTEVLSILFADGSDEAWSSGTSCLFAQPRVTISPAAVLPWHQGAGCGTLKS